MKIIQPILQRYSKSAIAQRMAHGAFWSFTGTAIAKLFVLASSIICARILTKAQYGEFGIVRSTINMFVVFGSAGIGLTATKYISEYRNSKQARISSVFQLTKGFSNITAFLISLVIFVLSPYLAENTLQSPQLTNALRLGSVLLFFTVLNAAQNGTLAGLEKFRSIAVNTLLGSIAESVLMLVGAYLGGVKGAILGYGCGFLLLYICNRISIHRAFSEMHITTKYNHIERDDYKILYKFTIPAALSSFLVMPAYWICRTMLVRKCGFEELAVYEAAEQWRTIILFVPTAISHIVLPLLSSVSGNDSKKFWKILNFNLLINMSLALCVALVVSLFSGAIVSLYGSGYSNRWPLLLLSMSTVFSVFANVVGSSIASRAKMWVGFSFNLIWATLMVLFTSTFLHLGATGNALAILISYVTHSLMQYLYLRCSTR